MGVLMDGKIIPRRLKPDGFCGCNGTAEAVPLQGAGAKARIILGRLRHDQGRALIQKRIVRHFSASRGVVAVQSAGAKARIILWRLRHDQGRALIQGGLFGTFPRAVGSWPFKAQGLKPGILWRLRHDQGRALIQGRFVRHFSANCGAVALQSC
jgi:hypothetical protein